MRFLDTSVTYLEMRQRAAIDVPRPQTDRALRTDIVRDIPLSYYRYLYDTVGRAHHWTSRRLSDAALASEIHARGITVHVLYGDGAPLGWFELDSLRKAYETRIVHFGVLPEFRRLRLSGYLLSEAITAAFATRPVAVTIETNTLDHPAALPLYRKFGFRVVSRRNVTTRAIEDD